MPSTEFIVINDPHLNSLTNLFPNYDFDPNTLIYKALNQPLFYAKENGVENIIITGDIFDHPDPDQKSQQQFLEWLITHNKFKFFIIYGNHDYQDAQTVSLQISSFARTISSKLNHVKFIQKPELVKIDDIPFSFLPWPYHKSLHIPSVNIAHIEIKGSKADNGKVFTEGYKLSSKGVWYIGHLHRQQEYGNVFYGGNLYQKTFAEPPLKGFYHVEVTLSKALSYKNTWIPIKTPFKLEIIKVLDPQDLKSVKAPNAHDIIQYRLLLRNNVELPPNFMNDHPNVIDVTGKLNTKEINDLEKANFSIDLINSEVDILDGLGEFLLNEGLSKLQIKQAKRKAKSYIT